MSYDVRIWGRKNGDLGSRLSPRQGWTETANGWVLAKRSWQIIVGTPQPVEAVDIPAEIAEMLPGLSSLTEVILEPVTAPKSARATLAATVRGLAEELAGVIEDPQECSATLPRGTRRYPKPKREERLAVLKLSWWYMNSPLNSVGGVSEFLSILRRHIGEAVPRRYGPWEPPRYTTEETGTDALAEFIIETLGTSSVFYTERPVVGFYISDCAGARHPQAGFRANCFRLEIETAALDQPGWERAIRNLWHDVSRFLQPFYGDARILRDYLWSGATLSSDTQTEVEPVRSWFWRGIPPNPGLALVIGPPYTGHWAPENAVSDGDLSFVETDIWADRMPLPLVVPGDIAQRWTPGWVAHESGGMTVNWCDELPDTWPF